MSLKDLEKRIDTVRNEAASVTKAYGEHREFINHSPHLSQAGKDAELTPLQRTYEARMKELRAKEKEIVSAAIRGLQQRVYGRAGSTPDAVISFRDAQERAERLDSPDDALTALRRAMAFDDAGLAHAILGRSVDMGWRSVIAEYSAENPAITEALEDLTQLTAWQNDSGEQLGAAMHYYHGGA